MEVTEWTEALWRGDCPGGISGHAGWNRHECRAGLETVNTDDGPPVQHRHGAGGAGWPLGHGREPVLDVLDRDGVHAEIGKGGQDVLADHVGVGFLGSGLTADERGGEGVHRVSWRSGAVVLLRRFDVAGDQPAGLAPRLGDGHGVGTAVGGVAPAHHAGEESGADSGGLDGQREPAHHVVTDFEFGSTGLGGAGRAVSPCRLRDLLSIDAKAGAGGKGTIGASGVPPKR